MDYSKLSPGDEISKRTYVLDADTVSKYVDAVGDRSRLGSDGKGRSLAPPMVVAALGLRGVVNDLAIPGGTLHVGQELAFKGVIPVGETLECQATLVQNSVRGEWRFMVVQMEVCTGNGRKVLDGKSTIILPEGR